MYKQQTFPTTKQEYVYNEEKGGLVENGETDIQKLVDSSLETSLEAALDRLFPEMLVDDGKIEEYQGCKDALDEVREAKNNLDAIRDKYGFDDNITDAQMVKAIQAENEKLKAQLNAKEQVKVALKESKTFVKDNVETKEVKEDA